MTEDEELEQHHRAVSRGHKARAELEFVDGALKGLRQAALEEIVVTPPEHAAKRDRLVVCCQLIDAIRKALDGAIDAGESANAYRMALAEQDLLRP